MLVKGAPNSQIPTGFAHVTTAWNVQNIVGIALLEFGLEDTEIGNEF